MSFAACRHNRISNRIRFISSQRPVFAAQREREVEPLGP
jgi:hypothetical protein